MNRKHLNVCVVMVLSVFLLNVVSYGQIVQFGGLRGEGENSFKKKLVEIIPASDELKGVKKRGETEFFDPLSLHRYINGRADHFVAYHCKMLAHQEYDFGKKEGSRIILDIYLMGNLESGFGIFRSELPVGAAINAKIETEGYQDDYNLVFFKGSYYVTISNEDRSRKTRKAVGKLAKLVEDKIPDPERSHPEILKLFPKEHMIEKSEQMIAGDFFAIRNVNDFFTARYKEGEQTYTLFLRRYPQTISSEAFFNIISRQMHADSTMEKEVASDEIDKGRYFETSNFGNVTLCRKGAYLFGAINMPPGSGALTELIGIIGDTD